MNNNIDRLHSRALKLFKLSGRIDRALISTLREIEKKKGHLSLGYGSLFQYCMAALGMTEGQASTYINVSRACEQTPELKDAVESGAISVNKANRIAAIVKESPPAFWIEQASTKSQRELEFMIANAKPELAKVKEKAKPLGNDRVMLVVCVSKTTYERLERSRDLLSGSLGRAATMEDVQDDMSKLYMEFRDPVRKAVRAARKAEQKAAKANEAQKRANTRQVKPSVVASQLSRPVPSKGPKNLSSQIPASVKHEVYLRDRGKCQHPLPGGKTCGSTRWVDLHHIIERARGGTHTPENITTLCHSHHAGLHAGLLPPAPITVHVHGKKTPLEAKPPVGQGQLDQRKPETKQPALAFFGRS